MTFARTVGIEEKIFRIFLSKLDKKGCSYSLEENEHGASFITISDKENSIIKIECSDSFFTIYQEGVMLDCTEDLLTILELI